MAVVEEMRTARVCVVAGGLVSEDGVYALFLLAVLTELL